jgi:16S rRNA processing protein RimM
MAQHPTSAPVVVGEFVGVYGVKGWLKVRSFTQPIENIFGYAPWFIGGDADWTQRAMREGRPHGKGLIVALDGIADRDLAAGLVGQQIAVPKAALPATDEGEYYWADLEGLRVETMQGVDLGIVDRLMETGSNDVLIVAGDRERLIPFVRPDVVREIDLDAGCIKVEWDPDF